MNEVKIIVTAQNQTFQEFERIRQHVARINGDFDKFNRSLPEKFRKSGQESGEAAGKALFLGITHTFGALPNEVKVAGVAAGAAFAAAALPAIAATLSAGVLAGAAIAAVAGGLKIAAQDPAVQDAAAGLGKQIMAHLQVQAMPFVGEALGALDAAGDAWARNSQLVERAFAAGARYVKPLTDGAIALAENALPAIVRAIERAGPVVNVLSKGLGDTGKAIGIALDQITRNGDEAAAALQLVLDVTNTLIAGTGRLIGELSEAFGTVVRIGAAITGVLEDSRIPLFAGIWKDANDQFERLVAIAEGRGQNITGVVLEVGKSLDDYGAAAAGAARETEKLNQAFDDLFNKTMDVDRATIRYQQAIDDLTEAIKENGRTIDANTDKGRANRDSILDVIDAIERQRQAAIAAGNGSKEATDAANAAYNVQLAALREQLRQLGLLTPAVDALLQRYNLLAQPITKTITIKVIEQGRLMPARGQYALASGGIAPAVPYGAANGPMIGGLGGMLEVGEYGRELTQLPPGTRVHSNNQSRSLVADALASIGGAGALGGGRLQLEVIPSPQSGTDLLDAVIRGLSFRVRDAGGGIDGVVQTLGGR